MTRWKASGIHFTISLLIGALAFCLLYFIYYPQPYFDAAGASKLVVILLGVDVILGPLLTLVVFKTGKKSLKFDLSTIAALQIAALVYGLYVMWVARPVFIVAVVDRIEIVYAQSIAEGDFASAAFSEFSKEPLFGPVFAITRKPKPGAENNEMMGITLAGSDIHFHPKYYMPVTRESMQQFLQRSIKISDLPAITQKRVAEYRAKKQLSGDLIAVPMKGRVDDYTVLVDQSTLKIEAALPVSAWE